MDCYTGNWYLKDDKFCLELKVWLVEKTKCDDVYRQDQWLVSYNKKGKLHVRLTKVGSIEYGTSISPD